ncbi:MAG: type II toxin-antitoxin system HicB family antitoxin [Ignavibacteriae bacterium]|nr:type II toxin-antitoxin system HicB family antitoxin [Ignavibacteriota bacterium]
MKKGNGLHNFTLEYWKDKTWYVGRLKEVPGVFSQGKTLTELKENIQDAYKMMLEETELYLPSQTVRTTVVGVAV